MKIGLESKIAIYTASVNIRRHSVGKLWIYLMVLLRRFVGEIQKDESGNSIF